MHQRAFTFLRSGSQVLLKQLKWAIKKEAVENKNASNDSEDCHLFLVAINDTTRVQDSLVACNLFMKDICQFSLPLERRKTMTKEMRVSLWSLSRFSDRRNYHDDEYSDDEDKSVCCRCRPRFDGITQNSNWLFDIILRLMGREMKEEMIFNRRLRLMPETTAADHLLSDLYHWENSVSLLALLKEKTHSRTRLTQSRQQTSWRGFNQGDCQRWWWRRCCNSCTCKFTCVFSIEGIFGRNHSQELGMKWWRQSVCCVLFPSMASTEMTTRLCEFPSLDSRESRAKTRKSETLERKANWKEWKGRRVP
jgi:hypothetical protein